MWAYCYGQELAYIFHENYELPLSFEEGTGSCDYNGLSTILNVNLNKLSLVPSSEQLIEGFTLTGDELNYSEGVGTIQFNGELMELYPFEVVDCTTDCTENPKDGWWELHSIMAGTDGRICFGILYLMVSYKDEIQLGYPICFNPLESMDAEIYKSSWSSTSFEKKSFLKKEGILTNLIYFRPRPPYSECL